MYPYRWDEWVPALRLLKLNEGNIAMQKSLAAQANAQNAASSSKHGKVHGNGASGGTGSKDAGSSRAGRKDGGTRGTKRAREEASTLVIYVGSD
jgi:mortality factor 4-like protein 1